VSGAAADGTLAEIAGRHRIELLLQFGSTITGAVHPRSDVDLAALFERPPGTFEALGLAVSDVQSLFPDREVDLVVLNRADPLLMKKVLERCRVLHGSARRLAELRIQAFRRYQDHRRYLAMEREYVRRVVEAAGR
jgi:predicted nucleotidyltransferase